MAVETQDDTPLTAKGIAEDVLKHLNKNLVFGSSVSRPYKYKNVGRNDYIHGGIIDFEYEPRDEVLSGMLPKSQPTTERIGSMTLQRLGVDPQFLGKEYRLNQVSVQEKLADLGQALAEKIDIAAYKFLTENCCQFYNSRNFEVPKSGVEARKFLDSAQSNLTQLAVPVGDRTLIVSPSVNSRLLVAFYGMFNPQVEIGNQFKNGLLVKEPGFKFKQTHVFSRIVGEECPTEPVEISAFFCPEGATVARVTLKEALKSIVSKGTRVRIDGCYFVNPSTLDTSDSPCTFTVQEETAIGAKELVLNCGALTDIYTQVSTPVAGNLLSFYLKPGVIYDCGILLQKGAMVMGSVPLSSTGKHVCDESADVDVAVEELDGITLTVSKQWSYELSIYYYSIDLLFGFAMQNCTSLMQLLMINDSTADELC